MSLFLVGSVLVSMLGRRHVMCETACAAGRSDVHQRWRHRFAWSRDTTSHTHCGSSTTNVRLVGVRTPQKFRLGYRTPHILVYLMSCNRSWSSVQHSCHHSPADYFHLRIQRTVWQPDPLWSSQCSSKSS